jgi:hypothetical protein
MVNHRVADLAAMLAQLCDAGAVVDERMEDELLNFRAPPCRAPIRSQIRAGTIQRREHVGAR